MCRLRCLSAETGHRSFRLLPPNGPNLRYAELLLYGPAEITPDCPLMAGSALRYSGFEQLLRPRLTSVHPSRHFTTPVAHGRQNRYPRVIRATFLRMPVGSTSQRSVQVLGFGDRCHLTPLRRLLSASCSSGQQFASGFLQIRSHPRHPCLWLTLPLAGCVEDFHLQVVRLTTTVS